MRVATKEKTQPVIVPQFVPAPDTKKIKRQKPIVNPIHNPKKDFEFPGCGG